MISRRRFLEVGGVTAGMAASRSLVAAAAAQRGGRFPATIARQAAIAQERGRAHFARRAPPAPGARAATDERELARRHPADGRHFAATTSPASAGGAASALFALVLPAKGEAFYVCPAFEEGRAREQIAECARWRRTPTFASGRRTRARTSA